MRERRFGPRELYAGSRFLAPLSEEALLEAGRAANLREGATLLEVGAGNGCAATFLAEAFHLYARGVESDPDLLELAQASALKSPARHRLRFSPPETHGPVDCVAVLRVPFLPGPALLRPGGRLLLGRFFAPEALGFPRAADPPGRVAWRRVATPLEWERFLAPLEIALRACREGSGTEGPPPLAEAVERQIAAFRAHAAVIRYELTVAEA